MSFNYKNLTKFEINVGAKEAKIRLIAGAALLTISLFTAWIPLLLIGVILVATGYTNVCPAYSAMDRNTCDASEETTK